MKEQNRAVSVFHFIMLLMACFLLCSVVVYAEAAQDSCAEAEAAFERLKKHKIRSGHRDVWLALAERFDRIYDRQKKPEAMFRAAEMLEELSRRSGLVADRIAAENKYLAFANRHRRHPRADQALYRASTLMKGHNMPGSLKLHRRLTLSYPKSPYALQSSKIDKTKKRKETRKIFIDPGHGGRDKGTQHFNITESRCALDIALKLGERLRAAGFTVVFSRRSDKGIGLRERSTKAELARADLFVSVHINANPRESVQGFETYVCSGAHSESVRIAKRENASLGAVRFVTSKKHLPEYRKASLQAAESVHRSVMRRLKAYGVRNGGIKNGPFYVLRRARVPSFLIEAGYCTNREDARRLANSAYRAAVAEGIASGITEYFRSKS
ncbi:MAG: N-acetylmuramoyl-L-alanine amidase [Desulfovibrionaceae bacterium]|nr:N-acetylmuramoyl-L-alanine amidase [Desulfovibrionaceae bacterium]